MNSTRVGGHYWANAILLPSSVKCFPPNSKCSIWFIFLGSGSDVTFKALVCITADHLVWDSIGCLFLNSQKNIKMQNKIPLFSINLNLKELHLTVSIPSSCSADSYSGSPHLVA